MNILNSKILKEKWKQHYADFENTLVQEDHREQNSEESYTNKYQKHVACSDGYNSVCVNVAYPFKLRISFKNFY